MKYAFLCLFFILYGDCCAGLLNQPLHPDKSGKWTVSLIEEDVENKHHNQIVAEWVSNYSNMNLQTALRFAKYVAVREAARQEYF